MSASQTEKRDLTCLEELAKCINSLDPSLFQSKAQIRERAGRIADERLQRLEQEDLKALLDKEGVVLPPETDREMFDLLYRYGSIKRYLMRRSYLFEAMFSKVPYRC